MRAIIKSCSVAQENSGTTGERPIRYQAEGAFIHMESAGGIVTTQGKHITADFANLAHSKICGGREFLSRGIENQLTGCTGIRQQTSGQRDGSGDGQIMATHIQNTALREGQIAAGRHIPSQLQGDFALAVVVTMPAHGDITAPGIITGKHNSTTGQALGINHQVAGRIQLAQQRQFAAGCRGEQVPLPGR